MFLAILWAKERPRNSTLPSCGKGSDGLVLKRPQLSSDKTGFTKQVVVAQRWPRGARLPTTGPAEEPKIKTVGFPFPQDAFPRAGENYRIAMG